MLDSCIICDGRRYGDSILPVEVEFDRSFQFQQANLKRVFQLLERHLDDISLVVFGATHEYGTSQNLRFQLVLDAGFGACDRCSKVVESFCDLYRQMKSIELLLNWKVQTLANLMEMESEAKAPRGKKNVQHGAGSLEGDDKDHNLILEFRRDLVLKCRRKLRHTFPRVKVKDVGNNHSTLMVGTCELLSSGEEVTSDTIEDPGSLGAQRSNDDIAFPDSEPHDSDGRDKELPKAVKRSLSSEASTRKQIPPAHINPETGKIKCGACPKEFTRVDSYRIHYQSVHLEIKYECPICGKVFTRSASYQHHHRMVHLVARFKCNRCNKQFTGKRSLAAHQRLCGKVPLRQPVLSARDPVTGKHKCHLCKKEFLSASGYYSHRLDVHKDVRFKCHVCSKEFSRRHALKMHQHQKHPDLKRDLLEKCTQKLQHTFPRVTVNDIWSDQSTSKGGNSEQLSQDEVITPNTTNNVEDYISLEDLKYNRDSDYLDLPDHDSGSRDNEIPKDAEVSPSQVKIGKQIPSAANPNHVLSAPDPVTGKYKCNLCKKEFISAGSYKAHHKYIHVGVKFKCPICNKLYPHRYALKEHQLMKHPDFVKGLPPNQRLTPHVCEHCGKGFCRPYLLKLHLKTTHLKLKEHVCDQCGLKFGLLSNLQKHVKTVHLKVREHICDVCGNGFGKKSDLQLHLKAVHLKLREHICDICGKGFTSPRVLQMHVKSIHQKFRRFECDICEKKFSRKEGMIAHRRRHQPEDVVGLQA